MRSGIVLLDDVPGTGPVIERQQIYQIELRMWLNKGEPVRWKQPWGPVGCARLAEEGAALITEVRFHRNDLANGLFYGIEGMRVGGTRRLRISPHMAYGERGVPGVIPANAVLTAEVRILDHRRKPMRTRA